MCPADSRIIWFDVLVGEVSSDELSVRISDAVPLWNKQYCGVFGLQENGRCTQMTPAQSEIRRQLESRTGRLASGMPRCARYIPAE
jgi:hypothetical protein